MTECTAEESYCLNDPQRQRLALEALLGEPSPSWLVALAFVDGVTNLARFHEVLAELARVYPVLRTTFVQEGPADSWYQRIRGCHKIWSSPPPVYHVPKASSWDDLFEAMESDLESRNPDYRYAAAYGLDDDGRLRVAFAFDHMAFDIRSIDIVLAHLAKNAAGSDGPDLTDSCRCGGNDFVSFVKRTAALAESQTLPERYEWAHDLMLAARSPHAFVSLPVTVPMSVMKAGGTTRYRSRFVTDPGARHSYTPFAAFASAVTISLEANFESPALFYSPSLNRLPAEMDSVGWFAGTPILAVHSKPIMSAVAADRILDAKGAVAEAKAASTEAMADGTLLTTIVHRKVSDGLGGGRLPYMDCLPDSMPYIILGFVDSVRERLEWKGNEVTITKVRPAASASPPPLVPPGYTLVRLIREKKGQWSVVVDYETERYQSGAVDKLMASAEGYLRQLLG
ncbi:MAG TPA: hypothetical protein VFI65_16575 [Streptosporangiaceae bacterium]|nr:hypothetical protein [Streptosporangiaceae bacterium]